MSIYAVNGKEPIAAWIPSLDTAGNGTTTLTDLVGSANGTLTNMDPATDWVADTDAGGIRALDFDGVNDFVQFGNVLNLVSLRSISLWLYLRSSIGTLLTHRTGGTTWDWYVEANTHRLYQAGSGGDIRSSVGVLSQNAWNHIACVVSGGTVTFYTNGVAAGSFAIISSLGTSVGLQLGAWNNGNSRLINAKIDDVRIWDQALDATDVASLYNSGTGRGITAGASANPTAILQINSHSMRVGL